MYRCYYEVSSGRLVSVGSVWPEQTPEGLAYVETEQMPMPAQMWDVASRSWVTRPPKVLVDRLQEILTDGRYSDFQTVWNNLSAARRTQLRDAMNRLLGRAHYRTQSQSMTVEEPDA